MKKPSTPAAAVKIHTAKTVAAAVDKATAEICGGFPPEIIQRLRSDPDGKVSAAFNRLKSHDKELLVFLTVQAVNLAATRFKVMRDTKDRAAWCTQAGKRAKKLADDINGLSPIEFQKPLRDLAVFMAEQAESYRTMPTKLNISRKANVANAAAILALRHLRKWMYKYAPSGYQTDHAALSFLVSAGLGIEIAANERGVYPNWVREALRDEKASGDSSDAKPLRTNKTKKSPLIV